MSDPVWIQNMQTLTQLKPVEQCGRCGTLTDIYATGEEAGIDDTHHKHICPWCRIDMADAGIEKLSELYNSDANHGWFMSMVYELNAADTSINSILQALISEVKTLRNRVAELECQNESSNGRR